MPIITTIRGNLRPFGKRATFLRDSTGGTISTAGAYRVHTFSSIGTTNFNAGASGSVEVLVLAGGGSGGSAWQTGWMNSFQLVDTRPKTEIEVIFMEEGTGFVEEQT